MPPPPDISQPRCLLELVNYGSQGAGSSFCLAGPASLAWGGEGEVCEDVWMRPLVLSLSGPPCCPLGLLHPPHHLSRLETCS